MYVEVPWFEMRLSVLNPDSSVSQYLSYCHNDDDNHVDNEHASFFLAALGTHLCIWKLMLKRRHMPLVSWCSGSLFTYIKQRTDNHSPSKNAQFTLFPIVKKAKKHTFTLLIIQPILTLWNSKLTVQTTGGIFNLKKWTFAHS